MRAITYSWIGLSAAAPLIFLLCAWVLGVFHSYRRQWRSVDLFLLAVFVQELLMALQVFAYALLSLMRPESAAACGAFVWSLSATRTLQAATVASLLVDRALTSQWPYKYRFSVRRHQIRYHLAVLATIAALVGVAAILARPSNVPDTFEHCSFMPHALHVRLSLFVLSVYGLLIVAGGVSVGVVQAGRGCSHPSPPNSDLAPITATTSSTSSSGGRQGGKPLHAAASSASTTSSNASSGRLGGGHGALQGASSTSDLVPPPPPPPHRPPPALPGRVHKGVGVNRSGGMARTPATDFRWGTTLAVAGLCFLVNHLPYMGLTVVGTFLPNYLPAWPVENIALWLSLAEGLLLPPLLGLVDATFSDAAGSSCSRDKSRPHKFEANSEGPFRLFPKDEVKSFPLTNGSLFSSLLNMNVDNPTQILPSYRRGMAPNMKMGVTSQEIRGLVGTGAPARMGDTYGPPYYPPERTESMGSTATSSHDPIYSDPLSKVDSVDSSLKEDHIYATLSETFGSMSSLSDGFLGDDQRCSSVTTVANDDFEFHDPRAAVTPEPVQYAREDGSRSEESLATRPPAELPPEAQNSSSEDAYKLSTLTTESSTTYSMASSFRSSSSQVTATIESHNETNREEEEEKDEIEDSPSTGYLNAGFECDTLELKKEYFSDRGAMDSLDLRLGRSGEDSPGDGTLSRKHRSSSLSMNDLDKYESSTDKEEEMMFILPVKSESMLSLYRLYLAEDEAGTSLHYSVEVSRSEGDLSVLAAVEGGSVEVRGENALHEVYQKRRVPETTGSKVKRQHKIQRAKGMQRAKKPPAPPPPPPTTSDTTGMQVAVMDKARRRNGIITIQDPSVLSVEELFRVLDRASATPVVPYPEGDEHSASPLPAPTHRQEPDYKKIFVSEYL